MSILVDEKNPTIEVSVKYYSSPKTKVPLVFKDKDELSEWLDMERERRILIKEQKELEGKVVPENFENEVDKSVKTLETKWIRMSWGIQEQIYDHAKVVGKDGKEYIDNQKFKLKSMELLMREWNLVDVEGNSIPLNSKTISRIDANVAEVLYDIYQNKITSNDEDLENLG